MPSSGLLKKPPERLEHGVVHDDHRDVLRRQAADLERPRPCPRGGPGRGSSGAWPGLTRPLDSAALVPMSVTGEPTSKSRRNGPLPLIRTRTAMWFDASISNGTFAAPPLSARARRPSPRSQARPRPPASRRAPGGGSSRECEGTFILRIPPRRSWPARPSRRRVSA